MKLGTKTVLFGVHAFWWHFIVVGLAWHRCYKKWPDWKSWVAIFCHDLAYCGCPNIDGPEGKQHPRGGARLASHIVGLLTGTGWCIHTYYLSLLHSRDMAKLEGKSVSKLYAPDKASILFEPAWWYLLRARLSGELVEFKTAAIETGHLPPGATDEEWFAFYQSNIRTRKGVRELL